MKLTLKHLHHKPSTSLNLLIERHLDELGRSLQIDEARVVVEHHATASPPFQMSVHLVTPGPDVFAEATDHTLRAALQKTFDLLQAAIEQRQLKRTLRVRSGGRQARLGPPATTGQRK